MAMGYAFQNYDPKKMVRVIGTNLNISRKTARDIGVFIKNKELDLATGYLQKVAGGVAPIPYARFNKKTAHHKPFGPAGFPKRASMQTIKLLNSLKNNALSKGMNAKNLIIIHAAAHKGTRLFHPGGRERKNTHFELVARETQSERSSARRGGTKATRGEESKMQSKPKVPTAPHSKGAAE